MTNNTINTLNSKITELETVIKARKLFEDNVFKFGYLDVIEHTIKDLLKWERELKEQGND